MMLLIDVGNSRVKAAFLNQGQIQPCFAAGYEKNDIAATLDAHLDSGLNPGRIGVSNVAGDLVARDLRLYFEQRWSLAIEFVEVANTAAGVINGYQDFKALGVDRWSAIIAGWTRYRSALCLVDCGTALTVDLVSENGLHLGGFILPGLELMASSLDAGTEQIGPNAGKSFVSLEPGNSTNSCIANGILAAITSLIESSFNQLCQSRETNPYCILTGGNAEHILHVLKIEAEHDPDLVLRGVGILLELDA